MVRIEGDKPSAREVVARDAKRGWHCERVVASQRNHELGSRRELAHCRCRRNLAGLGIWVAHIAGINDAQRLIDDHLEIGTSGARRNRVA